MQIIPNKEQNKRERMKCLKALKANPKGLIALFIVTAALGIAAGLTAVLGIEE